MTRGDSLLALAVCCAALSLIVRPCHAWMLPDSRESPSAVDWTGAFKPEETAYVVIHQPGGGGAGDENLLGLQVLIRTLRSSGSDPARALVALISPHTSASERAVLQDLGCTLREVDDLDAPAFLATAQRWKYQLYFKKVYLWTLTQYQRVVYLDAGVVALNNLDELFLCGEYCLRATNWFHFILTVVVAKPDMAQYERLRALADSRWPTWPEPGVVAQMFDFLKPATVLEDEHDIFFMRAFGDIEAAPRFEAKNGQSTAPVMRLGNFHSLSAIYWYEFFSWNLHTSKLTVNLRVPSLSVSYVDPKPFTWVPALFFDLNWEWQELRDHFVPESWAGTVAVQMAIAAALWFVANWVVPRAIFVLFRAPVGDPHTAVGAARKALLAFTHFCMRWFPGGETVLGYAVGLSVAWCCLLLAHALVPPLTPPRYAWAAVVVHHTLLFFITLKATALMLLFPVTPTAAFAPLPDTDADAGKAAAVASGAAALPAADDGGAADDDDDNDDTGVAGDVMLPATGGGSNARGSHGSGSGAGARDSLCPEWCRGAVAQCSRVFGINSERHEVSWQWVAPTFALECLLCVVLIVPQHMQFVQKMAFAYVMLALVMVFGCAQPFHELFRMVRVHHLPPDPRR